MIRGNSAMVRGIQIFYDGNKENINPNGQPEQRWTASRRQELHEGLANIGHGNGIQSLYFPQYLPRPVKRIFNEYRIRCVSGEFIEVCLDRAILEIGELETAFDEFLVPFKEQILAGKEVTDFLKVYNRCITARHIVVHIVVDPPGEKSMFTLYFENKEAIDGQTEEDLLKIWARQIRDNESYRRMEISPIPNLFKFIVDIDLHWEAIPRGGLWYYAMIFEPADTFIVRKAVDADMTFALIDLAYNAKNIVVHDPLPYDMVQLFFRMQYCIIRGFEMLNSISQEEDEQIMIIMAKNNIKKLTLYKGTVSGKALIEAIEALKAKPGLNMKVTIGNLKLTQAEFEELRDKHEIVFHERHRPTMYIIRSGEELALVLRLVALNVEIKKEKGREHEVSTDVVPYFSYDDIPAVALTNDIPPVSKPLVTFAGEVSENSSENSIPNDSESRQN